MNQRQEKILSVYNQALDEEPEKFVKYYSDFELQANVRNKYKQLDNVADQITLAQYSLDFELASKLIDEALKGEEREKYIKLKEYNEDLDETLNIELLSEKYSFLGDLLEIITTDIETQQRIISLSDGKLEIFKQLLEKVKQEVSNPVSIMSQCLRCLGTSFVTLSYVDNNWYNSLNNELESFLNNGESLTESDKERLLFLYTSITGWKVKSIKDLREFGEEQTADSKEIKNLVDSQRNEPIKNIENIKSALLWKAYGISLRTAQNIVSKYQIGNIKLDEENKNVVTLYLSLYKIVTEKDAGKLIKIFDEFSSQKDFQFSYLQPVIIEDELRDVFGKELNKIVFDIANREYSMIDDIPVYDAGTDFKIIMSSIGAYQDDLNTNNYKEYWNSKHIRSHGNCCSLVANNNLSTAEIKNVCFGFTNFASGMLLRQGPDDLNSTSYSRHIDFTMRNSKFMLPDALINATRGKYNEIVYERRDLENNKAFFKKNPEYLVFFEEFDGENIDSLTIEDIEKEPNEEKRNLLKEQKRIWLETKRAAKDFSRADENGDLKPLPIVKINREVCAKNEIKKIKENFEKYLQTSDITLLPNIITQFENNRTGNKRPHDYIRELYFSQEIMENMISQIINHINNIKDSDLRKGNIKAVEQLVLAEEKNYDNCSDTAGAKPGFNHKECFKKLENIKQREIAKQK